MGIHLVGWELTAEEQAHFDVFKYSHVLLKKPKQLSCFSIKRAVSVSVSQPPISKLLEDLDTVELSADEQP